MRKLIVVGALVALSACSQKADQVAAPGDTSAPAEPATSAVPSSWTGFEPGSYLVTASNGAKMDYVLKEDGNFTMTDAAGKVTTGTLVMKDGKGCFTPAGGSEMCWTNAAPGPDGSWTATATDGTSVKVTKKPS